jgi:hypothetical protein
VYHLATLLWNVIPDRAAAELPAQPGAAVVPVEPDFRPGIDSTKLHFARKNFRIFFIFEFSTNFHPKTTDMN